MGENYCQRRLDPPDWEQQGDMRQVDGRIPSWLIFYRPETGEGRSQSQDVDNQEALAAPQMAIRPPESPHVRR